MNIHIHVLTVMKTLQYTWTTQEQLFVGSKIGKEAIWAALPGYLSLLVDSAIWFVLLAKL